jgi:hypothetical protein
VSPQVVTCEARSGSIEVPFACSCATHETRKVSNLIHSGYNTIAATARDSWRSRRLPYSARRGQSDGSATWSQGERPLVCEHGIKAIRNDPASREECRSLASMRRIGPGGIKSNGQALWLAGRWIHPSIHTGAKTSLPA